MMKKPAVTIYDPRMTEGDWLDYIDQVTSFIPSFSRSTGYGVLRGKPTFDYHFDDELDHPVEDLGRVFDKIYGTLDRLLPPERRSPEKRRYEEMAQKIGTASTHTLARRTFEFLAQLVE